MNVKRTMKVKISTGESTVEGREIEVLPLDLFQADDVQQMAFLVCLFARNPEVIQYYLEKIVFPAVLRHQTTKLKASGQDLGSDMLFGIPRLERSNNSHSLSTHSVIITLRPTRQPLLHPQSHADMM